MAAVCATGRFQSRCRPAGIPRDVLVIAGSDRPTQAIPKRPLERQMTLKPVINRLDGLPAGYAARRASPFSINCLTPAEPSLLCRPL